MYKKMKNIGYVIIREDINSPIIKSQVFDVLKILAKKNDYCISIIWFYRIDLLLKNNNDIKKLKKDLYEHKINFFAIPFISGRFPISWLLLPIVMPQWLLGFVVLYYIYKIRVFHCRSYHAGLVGYVFGKIYMIKYIFDPRSPFPEEKVSAGIWLKRSINYKLWKHLEKLIIEESFHTIAVSLSFKEELKKISKKGHVSYIPNNYPSDYYKYINEDIKDCSRCMPKIELCYVGSLGHWNNVDLYIRFFVEFQKKSDLNVSFLFIVPASSKQIIIKSLINNKICIDCVEIKTVEQDGVYSEIKNCTLGVYLMNSLDSRLGIKFVEYLAAGLPVVVSGNITGAAGIVKDYKVGIEVDPELQNIEEVINFAKIVSNNKNEWKVKCMDYAKNNYSPEVIANLLSKTYDDVMKSSD